MDQRSNDFHLTSLSAAAIDKGANTAPEVTSDFDGVSRPQGSAYDIGAYEYVSGTPAPVVTLSANPSTIAQGESSTLTWSSTNASGCTASGGWSGAKATAGSEAVSPTVTTAYTLSCTGQGGTDTQSATVIVSSGTTSPIAHYAFDNAASDSSGNGNHASLIGSPSYTTGKIGSALQLNGISQYATAADSSSLDLTSFSIAAWVNPAGSMTDFRAIAVKNYAYYLYASVSGYCGNGGVLGGFSTGTASYSVCDSAAMPVNSWSHVAVVYDGATLSLYRNGQRVASSAASGIPQNTSGALTVGSSQFGEYFSGNLDEVRIYGRALSASEIQALANPSVRGDLDGSGTVDLADVRLMIGMIVGQTPPDLAVADLDSDGQLTLGDVRELINILISP